MLRFCTHLCSYLRKICRYSTSRLYTFSILNADPGNPPEVLERNVDVDPLPRIVVGGQFNRWLNITRTVIIQGAEDPDRKIFMCEVCVARGTPFEQCHTTNYTSRLIGSPPMILQGSGKSCPANVHINI